MWHVLPDTPRRYANEEPGDGAGHNDRVQRPGKLCSHFSVRVVDLRVPGVFPPMQAPVYICTLAEEMVRRLETTPEGEWLAERLVAPPLDDMRRMVCGPDLEAITTSTCVPDRCRRSCQVGFSQILTELGLDATPPEQD